MKNRRLRLLVCMFALVTVSQGAETPATTEPKKPVVSDPALAPVQDFAGLPRVLLIGDSIAMGYTLPVRAGLSGRANVHRPPENCGETGRGLRRLEAWLGPAERGLALGFGVEPTWFSRSLLARVLDGSANQK
ncbi:MAG: hypothetical protein ACKVVO_00935 [Opitutaceae bacterium]